MEGIQKRIEELCKSNGLNYKQLSEKIGVSSTAIYSIVNGKSKPGAEILLGFEKMGISSSWVLTGEGEMLKQERSFDSQSLMKELELKERIIEQKDSLIQTLQKIIESQLLPLGKWLDVSFSRFVFFMPLKNKFRYINVMA